ncbi:zinc finger protein 33A-like [Entelurus aequoreus]|uniref:zinc finger protein 33A-like n=1 Tax=Entelurus aequoreus TaxID=161455 RepID=UPI002B1E47AD|nr:zinc finger protein 33A-like [Entelurus aequoreus]
MFRELVKQRLMAAADEIFALFERTIASYEEELSRSREEKERHRRQLEAVCKTQIVLHVEDVQQLIDGQEKRPVQPQKRRKDGELGTIKEGDCLLGPEEADPTKLQLNVVSVKIDDYEEKPQDCHKEDKDGDDSHKPLHGRTDCGGDLKTRADNKRSKKKKTGRECVSCSVCAKTFTQKGHLTQHMRTHTGEKPFSCSVCQQRFSQKGTMVIHMRTHTGETPFGCSLCGKSFSHGTSLTRHMSKHTGEKPFSCSVCSKRFPHQLQMKIHMRTHTGENPFVVHFAANDSLRR